MRQATQRYRQVYEKYFHSIATKCTSVNDLYRLLAVLGLNPTAAQIKVSGERKELIRALKAYENYFILFCDSFLSIYSRVFGKLQVQMSLDLTISWNVRRNLKTRAANNTAMSSKER
jgi:hypothetical protein